MAVDANFTVMLIFFAYVFTTTNMKGITSASQTIQDLSMQGTELEPEFDGTIMNVTYPAGREAVLTCSVRNLGKYKVGWLRASDQTVLALASRVVSHNPRISVVHEDLKTWRLRIRQLRESDRGCYMCQINASPMRKQIGCIDVQVPPNIIDEESSADLAVQELDDAVLTCRATGHPPPRVTWKREDGEPMLTRKGTSRELIRIDSYNGSELRLPRLERRQMGAYLCIASNDVPPAVSKRVSLSVHFAPSVRAPSQLLGAPLGSDVQLECHVEASPVPVSYWLKGGRASPNGFIGGYTGPLEQGQPRPEMLLDGPKYLITEKRSGFRGIMTLLVRSFSPSDVGTYHCVSTNSLGRAEGTLRLYQIKIHGSSGITDDQLNIIGGQAEAARDRGNSATSNVIIKESHLVRILITSSLGLCLTSSLSLLR